MTWPDLVDLAGLAFVLAILAVCASSMPWLGVPSVLAALGLCGVTLGECRRRRGEP